MFKKILIANRGEIACRIMRTANKLHIRTAVIYHPIEQQALYVKVADEAVCITATTPRAAYLDSEKIIAAAKQVGAEAIHPGYGFLAENQAFAVACQVAGIVFIGPQPHALEIMGQKDTAKQLMATLGVPTIPGYWADDQTITALNIAAAKIGFPLLIKAVAGGGGKAMRLVTTAEELQAALPLVQREAEQSFMDARIMLEKYVPNARHIEVQIFGDHLQNYVHLFERDCSLQRRYQKILEEAPADNLAAKTREHLYQAALAAARAVNYVGAGTVEFLVAGDEYYFLEMNTRLQVEHPVTELVTGVDLVEWQIRVASGESLPTKQDDLHIQQHAIEVRICAEDPCNDFLPAIGVVESLQYPVTDADIRVENGIQAGDNITPYFDSLLAKLVVKAPTRTQALQLLQAVLADTQIVGVKTNVAFLQELVGHLRTISTPLSTQSLVAIQKLLAAQPHVSPWEQTIGWRLNAVNIGQQVYDGELSVDSSCQQPSLQAPMPGIVVQLYVQEGQKVQVGDRLLAIEAMKMEHTLRAPNTGVVGKLHCQVGDMVHVGVTLVELEVTT